MLVLVLINITIALILLLMNLLLGKKETNEREKPSPFECGFEPMSSSRVPFSLHFFVIAVVFLIFDVEITMILPFAQSLSLMNMTPVAGLNSFFLFILLGGLYAEWNQNVLEWMF